jgi:nucleotide-binding universal stress UspA family protein
MPSLPVVVGFDGSPDARAAVLWAARAALAAGAALRVVHAVGLLEHAGMNSTVAHREAALAIAAEGGLAPTEVEWRAIDGNPCSALLRMSEPPEAAQLLVVGSRGAGAHGGTLLGSTSLELAEHAVVPVTIVPASYR